MMVLYCLCEPFPPLGKPLHAPQRFRSPTFRVRARTPHTLTEIARCRRRSITPPGSSLGIWSVPPREPTELPPPAPGGARQPRDCRCAKKNGITSEVIPLFLARVHDDRQLRSPVNLMSERDTRPLKRAQVWGARGSRSEDSSRRTTRGRPRGPRAQ